MKLDNEQDRQLLIRVLSNHHRLFNVATMSDTELDMSRAMLRLMQTKVEQAEIEGRKEG